jgi:type VI protein secretion system component VasK
LPQRGKEKTMNINQVCCIFAGVLFVFCVLCGLLFWRMIKMHREVVARIKEEHDRQNTFNAEELANMMKRNIKLLKQLGQQVNF